jgi:hypothetical protein
MSNKRYLEIDSTYRNRNQYENASNFTVLIAQSGTRDAARAYDPVSNAAPIKTWIPDDLESTLNTGAVQVNATNTVSEFIVFFPVNTISKDPGYYKGYPITVNTEDVQIFSWVYMSSNSTDDYFTIIITPSLTATPTGVITAGTPNTDLTIGAVFVPDGFTADHFYVGNILYNEDLNEWRPVISYDGTTKLIGLDLDVIYGGTINPTWLLTHTYSLRKAIPQYTGVLPVIVLPQPSNTSLTFTVDSDTIVRTGDFIRFTSGAHQNTMCRVVKYTGDGVVANPLVTPPIEVVYPNIITISCLLNPTPIATTTFEVLPFTYDNAVPFTYTGSLISQQEMVCYEIELINLVLPNKTLISGGRTAFYPYVYVELQNVSGASAGTQSVIYSNNPNSRRMLFRAAIDDIPNPLVTPFIKIDGDGMVQTVKFKPNDNFKFGVYLPNGDPLQTVEIDTVSPVTPDPLLQVSAMFSIKRL